MPTKEAIESFINEHKAKQSSEQTIISYSVLLKKFSEKHPMLPVEPEPIQKFLEQWNGVTRRNYFKIIRSFYRWLTTRYGIVNPTDKMELPKVKRKIVPSLSPEELEQLLAPDMSERDNAALKVMAGCGLRVSEVANLTFGDVGTDTITVKDSKTPEGVRIIPLYSAIRPALLALKDGHNCNEAIFWGEHPHRPLGVAGFQGLVKKAFVRAGIKGKKASPHTLRHTFAKNWIIQGGDVFSLQSIMGHKSIEITRQYVELLVGDLVTKNQKHNPLLVLSKVPNRSLTPNDGNITPNDPNISPVDDNLAR